MKLKLKAIVYSCDFRKNEWTLYDEYRASSKYQGELAASEVYLFISLSENQLIWFLRNDEIARGGDKIGVVDSRRWRLRAQVLWSPQMLGDYAKQAGFELVGIRSFEQAFREQREQAADMVRIAREAKQEALAKEAAEEMKAKTKREKRVIRMDASQKGLPL